MCSLGSGTPALQHPDIHLTREGGRVKILDHVHRRAGIARQGQHVNALPVQQTERDGRVPEAIERA